MAIYRGAGGAGDATNDATSQSILAAASAAQAATSAAAASASASQAATSATNSASSATSSANSATAAASSANSASTSATNAANSATAAQTAQTAAELAETNAETAEANAETAEANATTSAALAQDWATKTSGTVAGGEYSSKYNAQLAATSATNAANSATSASTSASAASTSATNAASSASAAATSETNAANSVTAAATSATNAANSATTATTQATNAASSATAAATSASNAATSETNAASSASVASTSATNAANSATSASTSATNAANSATSAAASYDSFDDRYLGSKTSDPSVDNDGNALLTGALYWNNVANEMRVWGGSSWLTSYLPATSYVQKSGDTMTGTLNVPSLTSSGNVTLSGGTANGVAYLNGSKVLTTGSALTFDGTNLGVGAGGTGTGFTSITLNGTSNTSYGAYISGKRDGSNAWAVGDAYALIGSAGYTTYVYGDNPATWSINGSERMRIDSSGNLLVGTTSNINNAKFRVEGGSQTTAQFYRSSTAASSQIYFSNGNGVVGQVYTDGSTTVYATSSDYRLKENIQPMQNALARNALLKPCTYSWKVDGSTGEGFIAHELQAVVPNCVTGEKDVVDKDGKPVYQGVDTSFLVGHLVACIQELKAELDATKDEVAALKGV